jgi:hypothetical protein
LTRKYGPAVRCAELGLDQQKIELVAQFLDRGGKRLQRGRRVVTPRYTRRVEILRMEVLPRAPRSSMTSRIRRAKARHGSIHRNQPAAVDRVSPS